MTQPSTLDLSLLLPQSPSITSTYDISNLSSVTSPDDNCVQNIKIVLAGFTSITDDFMSRNEQQWSDEGESWPDQSSYNLDGYTLFVEMELKDTNAVNVCVQKGTTTSDEDFTCFGIDYDSSEDPKVVDRFTNTISTSVSWITSSIADQSPTYLQANNRYESSCGSSDGATYTGGGVDECWGLYTTTTDDDSYVPIYAYLFLPTEFASSSFGYRWYAGDVVYVRVIARPGDDGTCLGGNAQTEVTLAGAFNLLVTGLVCLSSILF